MERVIAYTDGFNLYFGLKSAGLRRYYWLNLQTMAQNLLKPQQDLVFTKYFTSRLSYPPDKQKRQSVFIEALETLNDLRVYYGHYQANPQRCRKCGNKVMIPSEKMTDVNIAVEMMSDAYQNLFDVALLISADSDLTAPILSIKHLFPQKRVIVALSSTAPFSAIAAAGSWISANRPSEPRQEYLPGFHAKGRWVCVAETAGMELKAATEVRRVPWRRSLTR